MTELLPCPFCGQEPTSYTSWCEKNVYIHYNPDCPTNWHLHGWSMTINDIAAWNRRAEVKSDE